MKILSVMRNFKNQTPSGGYDQIAKHLGSDTVRRPYISSLPLRILEKAWHYTYGDKRHLFSHLGHGYHFEDRLGEEIAFWRAFVHRHDIIHINYGDWALDMLLRREFLLSAELVATFHLPAETVVDRFERVQRHDLEKLR